MLTYVGPWPGHKGPWAISCDAVRIIDLIRIYSIFSYEKLFIFFRYLKNWHNDADSWTFRRPQLVLFRVQS